MRNFNHSAKQRDDHFTFKRFSLWRVRVSHRLALWSFHDFQSHPKRLFAAIFPLFPGRSFDPQFFRNRKSAGSFWPAVWGSRAPRGPFCRGRRTTEMLKRENFIGGDYDVVVSTMAGLFRNWQKKFWLTILSTFHLTQFGRWPSDQKCLRLFGIYYVMVVYAGYVYYVWKCMCIQRKAVFNSFFFFGKWKLFGSLDFIVWIILA